MANLNERLPQNAPGKFYVDSSCVDCDMCRGIAPATFKRDDDIGMSIVFEQPRTPEEDAQATEAVQSCPTESIGWDGDGLERGARLMKAE